MYDASNHVPAGNPETGYLNCDRGATKTDILAARRLDALAVGLYVGSAMAPPCACPQICDDWRSFLAYAILF
jgi:hypothetical protein